MTLEPLLAASLPVQLLAATVFPTFFLGSRQIFLSTKGTWSPIWVRALTRSRGRTVLLGLSGSPSPPV